jgi:hypothetical protein
VTGLATIHRVRKAALAKEDTSRLYVRSALTGRPAAAEEAPQPEHKRQHGRLSKHAQRT